MPYISTDDIKIYYEVHGSGPPVLFLHGLGSSTSGWKYQVSFFSKDYQVILIDLRGHGNSGKPASTYSIELFGRDCEIAIRSITDQPLDIIGLSLGGFVAFQLALDYPSMVRSLTIVNSLPEFTISGPKNWTRLHLRLLITRMLGVRSMAVLLSRQLFKGKEYDEIRKEFIEEWARNDKKAYLRTISALRRWSIAHQLEDLNSPVFMLASELDYTSIKMKEYYAAKIPNCRLSVIKNTRHALPVEKPDLFNLEVLNFIRSIS